MVDPTPGQIAQLEPRTAALAVVLINAARDAGIPLIIAPQGGRRSWYEEYWLVIRGRSHTLASKHLTGQAFDIDVAGWNRNAIPAWFWNEIGPYGERLGLTWGGRWISPYDPGHFET